jgi:DNA-binding XRE family transcriptional regulator
MAETLGDRIRIERARRRLSRAALARDVGISTNALHAIEADEVDPRISRIKKMAQLFHVTTDYLIGMDGEPSDAPQPHCSCRPGTVGWARHHGLPPNPTGLPAAFDAAMSSFADDSQELSGGAGAEGRQRGRHPRDHSSRVADRSMRD